MSARRRDPRGRLSRPGMPGEPVDPIAVGAAAAMVGAELGLAAPMVFTRVVEAWADLVGEMLAGHSRVRSVRDGVIEVLVDSPAWATEFRYLESDLVTRVSRLVGEGVIRAVRATVEAPPAPPAPPGQPSRESGRESGREEPGSGPDAW